CPVAINFRVIDMRSPPHARVSRSAPWLVNAACEHHISGDEEVGAMQLSIEWLIGGVVSVVVSVGGIAVVRAIVTGLAISRRPPHPLAQQTGTSPVPPEIEIPPTFNQTARDVLRRS